MRRDCNGYTEYEVDNLPLTREQIEELESMPYQFGYARVFPTHVSIQTELGHVYAVFDIVDTAWWSIDTENHTWEYQEDENDCDTYFSGNFYTDEEDEWLVIDFDGSVFELPKIIRHQLRIGGYELDI